MNLASSISIYAGGAGSGCNPEAGKCGRSVLYHVTDEKHLSSILKNGLRTQKSGAPKTNTEFEDFHDKNVVYALQKPELYKTVIGNKLDFGEMEDGRESHQVLVAFNSSGKIVSDTETEDDDGKPWGVKHIGSVPPENIIGYHKISGLKTTGYPTKVSAKLSPMIRKQK